MDDGRWGHTMGDGDTKQQRISCKLHRPKTKATTTQNEGDNEDRGTPWSNPTNGG